ncbi:S41 family peptidase [uncultured Pseudoteredinibacter sp.]|uniref:S41 family peptidase n=1 Tax=uncultured Pseudoteredinibacter sp. TaxID=1641701 RepID=UPI002618BCBF|nr:S41 family peptidase [uncultured Pseudoteredinibacter sp.]
MLLLQGVKGFVISLLAALLPAFTVLAQPIVSDFNDFSPLASAKPEDSLPLISWRYSAKGNAAFRHVKRADGNTAIGIDAAGEKAMARLMSSPDIKLIQENTTVFRASVYSDGVEGGAHLFLTVKSGHQRIFKEDMKATPIFGDSDWQQYEFVVPRLENASSVSLGLMLFGKGRVLLDDVSLSPYIIGPSLGSAKKGESAKITEQYNALPLAEEFYQLLEDNFYFSDKLDMTQLYADLISAARSTRSEREVVAYFKALVASLNHRHTSYIDNNILGYPKAISRNTRNIVERRDGYAYAKIVYPHSSIEHIQASIESTSARISELYQEGLTSWVLDLRGMSGGNSVSLMDMVYPLLAKGRASGMITNKGRQLFYHISDAGISLLDGAVRKERVTYSHKIVSLLNPNFPLAVLIDKNTASAAESLALALRERPNTRFFGEASAAMLSANAAMPLSNGDILVLSGAQAIDNEGNKKLYIEPDVKLKPAKALEAALKWLESQ